MGKKILGFVNLYDSPSLGKLTQNRTLGSTSFLGRFALMDFALSNFTNANIDNINVLIKDNFRSVSKHCGSLKSWVTNTKLGSQNLLINERGASDKTVDSDLNAIRFNDWVLYQADPDYIVIQPAHIITSIELTDVINFHEKNEADITVVVKDINDGSKAFLTSQTLELDGDRIISCKENDGSKDNVTVSLRTYVISRKSFNQMLAHKDFRDAISIRMVIEKVINDHKIKVCGFKHEGYARCFDSFEHFIEYSFELLDYTVAKKLFRYDYSIYTTTRNTPPVQYGENSKVKNCFVANGAVIKGTAENSIISRYAVIEEGAVVKNCILLTKTVIKKGCVVENALIDKYAVIESSISGTKDKHLYIEQGKVVK